MYGDLTTKDDPPRIADAPRHGGGERVNEATSVRQEDTQKADSPIVLRQKKVYREVQQVVGID